MSEVSTICFSSINQLAFSWRVARQNCCKPICYLAVESRAMNFIDMSPEEFCELVERVSRIAGDYLKDLSERAIPAKGTGAEIEQKFRHTPPEKGDPEEALRGLRDTALYSRAQNGRFFGYVLGSGEPAAAIADLLCSVLNQNVTAWRSSPAAVTIEKEVVGWIAQAIGCDQFAGILTGGGSSANLMGLAMAREAKLAANECGVRATAPHAVYASTEAHMSISKAVGLLGIGRENLKLVRVDERFRMIPDALEERMRRDKELGIVPLAVVTTAGTVNTGALDPLPEIAQVAANHRAWLHVDGSYGALAAIALPGKFAGLAKADSLALDPHKWLYQPLDCGCLLHRDPQAARAAFAHSGDYVRPFGQDPIESHVYFEESIELSRRFRALKLWFSLRYHGLESFRESIKKDLLHAQRLGSLIERTSELELMAPIELTAVCFRYVGDRNSTSPELDQINFDILRRMNERGRVYLSNATLHSKFCLRACIVNHRTTDSDIDEVVSEVLSAAREVRTVSPP
jgi:glutamate/tyrosine decarboxylase-like PLP-dependent enzyme